MKSNLFKVLLLALVFMGGQVLAQTVTNKEALKEFAAQANAEYELSVERVKNYAEEHGTQTIFQNANGATMQMVDVQNGIPVYLATDNYGAAITTRASELKVGGSTGLDLTGAGHKVAIWDYQHVLTTHQEFNEGSATRVTKKDGNYPSDQHATHVGGTIGAAGVNANAEGMANEISIDTYNWDNRITEQNNAAAAGLEISNHSYGIVSGWVETSPGNWQWYGTASVSPDEDYKFGFYNSQSRTTDQLIYNAPYYLVLRSAGNARGEGPSNAGQDGNAEVDGGEDGYDCIANEEIAKNIMVVGAVYEVLDYTGPEDVRMTSFSCWGPCDDGRIKPDIVGKGLDVFSSSTGSNSSYAALQGTSMSCPNVAGTMALLQQHYKNLNGTAALAATMKGLALHTADECGDFDGPDYRFGWGLMNGKKAAQLISDNEGQNSIDERILTGGDLYQRIVTVPEGTPELRVSICWTDPPATALSPQLNPRTSMLVNDLDIVVTDPSTNQHFPYKLNYNNPEAGATSNSKNFVDNMELVSIKNPAPGNYNIQVTHDGSLTGGQQAYTLIISGIDDYDVVPECSIASIPATGSADLLVNEWIEWELANFGVSYDLYFGTDGGGTQTPTNVYNGENILTNGFSYQMNPSTTYYLQVVPQNSVGEASGCEIWEYTTMDAIDDYPHLETFVDADNPDVPFGWQAFDGPETTWVSTNLGGHTDNYSMICWNPDGVKKSDYDNWMVSPPFEVVNGREYNISYYYKTFLAGTSESMTAYWGTSPYVDDFSTVLFEDTDFNDAGWLEGQNLIAPGMDGYIFIAFHVESTQGYGVFLDDIMVEDKGVGTGPENEDDASKIYSYNKKVIIQAGESWNGSEIQISNIMGQLVYSGDFNKSMTIDLSAETGLYIVSMLKENKMVSKKIMIQ